jgi:Peptidase family C25
LRSGPGDTDPTLIPPYLIDIDPTYGEIACDSCYTRLDTFDPLDTPLPDVAIGRLPARTLAEAEVLVAKTVTALFAPPPGAWRGRMLLISDNDRDALGAPDPAGPFAPRLAEIASALPDLQAESFAYAPDQPGTASGRYASAPVLRERLLAAWDAGAALVAYVGHASPWQWAWTGPAEPVAHLLARSDAVRTNSGRLPILLSMTCLSGSFAHPTLAPIDEELLRQPGGGIVAAIAPSGSGVNTGHARLLAGILPALRAGQSLGAAHLAGLEALCAQPGDRELAFGYAILGDPEVRLPAQRATLWQIALPEVVR